MQAATAGVWNAQLKTAFANRLAVEARLSEMVDARDVLAKKKAAGTATAEDVKNLKALQTQIDTTQKSSEKFNANIAAAFEQNKQMNALGNQTWYAAQLDSVRNMGKKDQTGLTTYMAEAVNDQKMLWEKTGGAQGMDRGAANNVLSALKTGVISPAAASNLTNFGKELARLPAIINELPAPKLQDFATQIGNMTGPQAQSALQTFGQRFVNAARAANLSAKEAGNAARALGANKQQVKQVKINVKADKVKDPTAGLKNKNITVGALTGPAENRLKRLKKLAEEATGKDIKIKANSNADAVTKKLRKMIETGEAASGKGVFVDVDTNAPDTEGKVRTLADTIATIAGAGPLTVPLSAAGDAEGQINAAYDAGQIFAASNPTTTVTAIDAATPVLATTIAMLGAIVSKTVTVTVNKVETGGFTGGYFTYAYGGVHNGPGKVSGPGGPTDDKVNARLSDGEYVIRASSVDKYGTAFLNAVNRGAYEKQAYAKGTKPVPGATLPPKESDAKGRQAEFNKDWKQMMWEMDNFLNEFKAMPKIIKKATGMLSKKMRAYGDEFARHLMETYDPKQINKILNTKQGKKVAKQYQKEIKFTERFDKKQALREEIDGQKASLKAARARDQLLRQKGAYGQDTSEATVIGNMSDEQMQMYQGFKKNKQRQNFLKRLVELENINKAQDEYREAQSRKKELGKSYRSATGATLVGAADSTGLSLGNLNKYADALGMSIEDLAQQIENGDLPANFAALGEAALKAKKAMEVLGMTDVEKQSQIISNNQSRMSNLQDKAAAKARQAVAGKYGKSQSQLEAQNAVRDAQNAIDQATIDDINEKYDKQLNTIDQISQHQQAIANLERGRLSVAGALSSGDIAAAAAAAQEHRNNMASFSQDQMRRQLENQQKAATSALQDQINARMKESRDIQNQIALLTGLENEKVAEEIGLIQAANDELMTSGGYIDAANKELEEQNELLAKTAAQLEEIIRLQALLSPSVPGEGAPPPPSPPPGGGGPGGNTGAASSTWDEFNTKAAGLSNADIKFLEKETFKAQKGGGRWRDVWNRWSANRQKKVLNAVADGKISAAEEKELRFARGGVVPGFGNRDNISALLTPGEFVVNRAQAAKFGPILQGINSGLVGSADVKGSGNVNIENIIFQINGTSLSERDIADIAVRRMRTLDAATIRGGRF
jgi:hypothetical protein